MMRPRWHDAVIVSAIVALLVAGVWSLWWDDVRAHWPFGPLGPDPSTPAPMAASGQT